MINIDVMVPLFLSKVNQVFQNRVWFIGLQGSYARKEASESSDLDLVVILDELNLSDIKTYEGMLSELPHRELLCGFLSGKDELFRWDVSDLFQFCYDTVPLQGTLEKLIPLIDDTAIMKAIKLGACNLYHGCVHNMLYDKSEEILAGLYKSAVFTIQALYFQQTGQYVRLKTELLKCLSGKEHTILKVFLEIKNGAPIDFDRMSEILFVWAKNLITNDMI